MFRLLPRLRLMAWSLLTLTAALPVQAVETGDLPPVIPLNSLNVPDYGGGLAAFGDVNGAIVRINGRNGFRIDGVAPGDASGISVAGAGDVNGDGFGDLLIGASRASPGGNPGAGSSYVVFGKAAGFAAAVNLSALNGRNGFRLDGVNRDDGSGSALSGAGDINGDGFDDLIIGAPSADPAGRQNAGLSYVVYGRATGFGSIVKLSKLNGKTGFRLDGFRPGEASGSSVAGAGDVNGDGVDDLIIGAPAGDPGGRHHAGSSYVVFGRKSGFDARFSLASLNGRNGFRLDGGQAGERSGTRVAGADDVNGDGLDDVIAGVPLADPGSRNVSGPSYVVFGKGRGFAATIDLSSLSGIAGFQLNQRAVDDHAGRPAAVAGDVNGDGHSDLIVGAPSADPGGRKNAGSSYVVLGRSNWSINPGKISVSENQGTVTFTVSRKAAAKAETVYVSTTESEGSVNKQDYTGIDSLRLTFATGEKSKQVSIAIRNDTVTETGEDFGLIVQKSARDPRNTPVAKATFAIINDDSAAGNGKGAIALAPSALTITSALDTHVRQGTPAAVSGTLTTVMVDGSDGGGAVQGLLYFDVIGSAANQIPAGSTIHSATLTLRTTNGGNGGTFYRMLKTWGESATWSSMVNGIQTDNIEARSTSDISTGTTTITTQSFDVTSSVAAWSAGEANFGWAIIPLGSNGWEFSTREGTTPPSLAISYTPGGGPLPPTAALTAGPLTVTAGSSTTLAWTSTNATACTGSNFSTGGAVSGSVAATPAASTTYSVSCVGAGGTASASADVTVQTGGPTPINVRVAASADDAEESSAGVVNLSSSDLELVLDTTGQTVGMRFANIALPQGATITNAYVQFTVDEVSTAAASLNIQGVAADSATAFTTAASNVSSRPRTGASVPWIPASWPAIDAAGVDQRTPNIAAVIQEIVNRPGWAGGNALSIIVSGSGKRVASAFDISSGTKAPLLHVEYSTVADTEAPSVPTGLGGTAVTSTQINLNWNASNDNVAVTGYKVFRNGVTTPIATVASNSYSDTGLAANVTYSYAVSAVDAAGNESSKSGSISVTTLPVTTDNVPPSDPTGLAAAAVSSTEVNLKWNASTDNVGVTGYKVSRDGGQIATAAGTGYLVSNLAAGAPHTYTVTAMDAAGNVSGPSNSVSVTTPAATASIVFAGAGDIASVTGTAEQTAVVLDQIVTANPSAVIYTLGDNAYQSGSAAEYASYYTPTWGRHILRTRPAPGNHEYLSPGAQPYYDYFGATAGEPGKGYYSYQLGAWHIVSLNSEIDMSIGSPQEAWLRADLAAHPSTCILAYWHKPLFTSGTANVPTTAVRPLWQALYDYGADLILNGHQHNYERFAPQTPTGVADLARGIRQFVVGTAGGPSALTAFGVTPAANSEARNNVDFGVLKLTLNTGGYGWDFVHVAGGTFVDSGSSNCSSNTPDNTAPTVPTGVTGNAASSSQINLSWTASSDDVAVTGYKVFRNGVQVGTPASNSFSDTGLTANTAYSYTVSAFDAAGNNSGLSTPPVSVTTSSGSSTVTWEGRISASGNDAEQVIGSAANLTSSDLELVTDAAVQVVGLRFTAVAIPSTATITNAYVQFATDEVSTAATSLTIAGEAADNSAIFTTTVNNISARATTAATTAWSPGAWNTIDEAGANQRTPNLSGVVQQIVNRAGWTSGNALTIIVNGTGKRVARAFDVLSGAKAPLLHVEYSTAPDNEAPTAPTSLSGTGASPTRINLSWAASSDNVAVAGYKVFRGGIDVGTATGTSFADSGLTASTSYDYTVSAFDAAGNNSGPAGPVSVATLAVDNIAPIDPTGLGGTAVSSTQINLSWTASTDNVAVTGYKVFRNGGTTPIATIGGTSYSDTGLSASTTYNYTVSAFDAAGNSSGLAGPVSVTTQASTCTIRVPQDFTTIQAAINAAQNGNTVLVAPGTYPGGITITGKTITLASYFHTTGDPSYINTTTISGGTTGVNVAANSPNVIVKGLRFTGGSDSLVLRAPGGQAISNFFDHSGTDALSFEIIGGIARDNICIGAGDDCIDADVPTTDLLIENNTLETPRDDGIELRMEPLNAPPLPPLPNLVTVTIRGNKITGVDDDGIQLIDSPGIQNRRFVIERNLIRNSGKVGLGLMDNGVTVEDYRAASMPERIHVFNNTFDGNKYAITGGDNLIAINNIISNSTVLGLKNIDAASIVAYTLFWNNAQDQVGSNMDLLHTYSGNPLYTPSFGLGVGSPAINAGTANYTHSAETVLTIPPSAYTGTGPDLGPYESGL